MIIVPAETLRRLWRYYQVGLVNTLVGYGLFALLVAIGLNIFIAQTIAHIIGATFNYVTYSRHVFSDASASKLRFVLSYAFGYFVGIACLAAASTVLSSSYAAGFAALAASSLINFFVLRHLVFVRTPAHHEFGRRAAR